MLLFEQFEVTKKKIKKEFGSDNFHLMSWLYILISSFYFFFDIPEVRIEVSSRPVSYSRFPVAIIILLLLYYCHLKVQRHSYLKSEIISNQTTLISRQLHNG